MSPLLVLILFCHLTYTVTHLNRRLQDIPIGPPNDAKADSDEAHIKRGETEHVNSKNGPHNVKEIQLVATPPLADKTITKPPLPKNVTNLTDSDHKKLKPTEMESGALVRGVFVVLGLSILIIIYMALKTYCSKRNKPIMVRKYGVRTRRSDMEMTPLPLEEDEDDETVFEVGGSNR